MFILEGNIVSRSIVIISIDTPMYVITADFLSACFAPVLSSYYLTVNPKG